MPITDADRRAAQAADHIPVLTKMLNIAKARGGRAMQKLKPCPFCGGADIVTQRGQKQCLCMGCGAEGPEEKNRREAHDAWNRRTPDPSAVYNACMQAAASFVERKTIIEPTDDGTIFQMENNSRKKSLLMTAKEFCAEIGCGRSTFAAWQSAGKIPEPTRIGRRTFWRRKEIAEWIDARCPTREQWEQMRNTGQQGRYGCQR